MSNSCPYYKNPIHLVLLIIIFFSLGFFATSINPATATHSNSAHCGNGVCQTSLSETCNSCSADCGACSVPTSPPQPTSPVPTQPPASQPTATPAPNQPASTIVPGQPAATSAPSNNSSGSNESTPSQNEPVGTITAYPKVSLTSIPRSPTNDTTLSFSGNASISSGSISLIEYSLNNGSSWVAAGRSGNSFSFTTPGVNEGIYTVRVRAKSSVGEYTQSENHAQANITVVTTLPSVVLDEFPENPSRNQTPIISGRATSRLTQIRRAEISIDGGGTWSPTSLTNGRFQFQTKRLDDNNYKIKVRATDTADNVGTSAERTLIIDTIPPIIGGSMIAIGPQVLSPDKSGIVHVVAGSKVTLTLSMRGGTTAASVLSDSSEFKFNQIPGTHLWSTTINFENEGVKAISISAIDGADNKTVRKLQTIIVENYGVVADRKQNSAVENAEVSLYFYDPQSKSWVLWQADSYGQKNQQKTDKDGHYSFMAPPGKYYLETKSPLFRTSQSKILNLTETTILNFDFLLNHNPALQLKLPILGDLNLALPFVSPDTQEMVSKSKSDNSVLENSQESLPIGAIVPEFSLPDITNKQVSLSSYRGKKALLTFFAPWSDPSKEQMSALSQANKELDADESILGINLQESTAITDIFMRRGGYSFPAVADRNGDTSSLFQITVLPQHFLIDKNGKISQIHTGVLGKNDLLEKLRATE